MFLIICQYKVKLGIKSQMLTRQMLNVHILRLSLNLYFVVRSGVMVAIK